MNTLALAFKPPGSAWVILSDDSSGFDSPRWRTSMSVMKRVDRGALGVMHAIRFAVIRSPCVLNSGESSSANSAWSSSGPGRNSSAGGQAGVSGAGRPGGASN